METVGNNTWYQPMTTGSIVSMTSASITIITLNALVLFLKAWDKNFGKDFYSWLTSTLSISDLAVGICVGCIALVNTVDSLRNTVSCIGSFIFLMTSMAASTYQILFIYVIRIIAVKFPFRIRTLTAGRNSRCFILFVWTFAAVSFGFPLALMASDGSRIRETCTMFTAFKSMDQLMLFSAVYVQVAFIFNLAAFLYLLNVLSHQTKRSRYLSYGTRIGRYPSKHQTKSTLQTESNAAKIKMDKKTDAEIIKSRSKCAFRISKETAMQASESESFDSVDAANKRTKCTPALETPSPMTPTGHSKSTHNDISERPICITRTDDVQPECNEHTNNENLAHMDGSIHGKGTDEPTITDSEYSVLAEVHSDPGTCEQNIADSSVIPQNQEPLVLMSDVFQIDICERGSQLRPKADIFAALSTNENTERLSRKCDSENSRENSCNVNDASRKQPKDVGSRENPRMKLRQTTCRMKSGTRSDFSADKNGIFSIEDADKNKRTVHKTIKKSNLSNDSWKTQVAIFVMLTVCVVPGTLLFILHSTVESFTLYQTLRSTCASVLFLNSAFNPFAYVFMKRFRDAVRDHLVCHFKCRQRRE